ncbi:MAG: heptosyltransferase-2 [Gammaproteobacteria bacterium]|jgi:heptosyltransferase-2
MNQIEQRLVVRLPNWVGDLVMATPVLQAAAESQRFGDVRFLMRKHLAPLFADAPWAERIEVIGSSGEELLRYRELKPDAVLLLSNSFGAALRAWRAGIPIRAGSALSARRWLLTHRFVPPTHLGRRVAVPTAHLHRDCAGLLGITPPDLHPQLWVRESLQEQVRAELVEAGLHPGEPYVFCCPGAAFGAAKLWPPARFAEVLDHLHSHHGWRAVIGGGPGEEPLMQAVREACVHDAIELSAAPRDLERLKAQVKNAQLLLVGDSGPRWVAAAFDVPCVSIMGPNFPELTASSLELCRIVRLEGLECSPCIERTCPLGHHRCMQDLPASRAIAACEDVLALESAGV